MDEKESLDRSRESERAFASVAIVGLGLIGGSLAAALRRGGYRGRILGVSRPATIEEALARGLVDAGHPYEDLERATSEAELVVLATPISEIIASLRRLGALPGALRAGAIVSDVGSTKRAVVRAAVESLPAGVRFVGGHPLAGSEQRGL
ncbi:MAG: prephenate dehydrogenase, partial [Planctomycetota bacterium]